MTTFHQNNGRFVSRDGAHFAVRDGERFRVVRQLRRMTRKVEPREAAAETVERLQVAKQKAAMLGHLSAPGYINVEEWLRGR